MDDQASNAGSGAAAEQHDQSNSRRDTRPILSEQQVIEKELMAARGDPDAAMDLVAHFGSYLDKESWSMADHWKVIAAENGSLSGMQFLASQLEDEGGQLNCERALYWLVRMKARQAANPNISWDVIDRQIANLKGDLPACYRKTSEKKR